MIFAELATGDHGGTFSVRDTRGPRLSSLLPAASGCLSRARLPSYPLCADSLCFFCSTVFLIGFLGSLRTTFVHE